MKFIHIADVHLGAEPDAGKAYSQSRSGEIWNSFARIIEICEQRQVDLLLIAGDLFHRQPLKRELKEVDYLFSSLSHTQVVFIAGNHDYIKKNSYYLTYPWNENVHFLKGDSISKSEFPKFKTAVYGLSYHSKEILTPLYNKAVPDNDYPYQILLAHGGDEKHIPFRKKELLKLGYDYIALGHIHKPEQIVQGRVAYAGALEPIDKNDTGLHGYIEGSITESGCSITFISSAVREYIPLEIRVDKNRTGFWLKARIKEMIEQSGIQNIYKIILTGYRDPELLFDLANADAYGNIVELEDHTRPFYDFEKLMRMNRENLLGRYIESFVGSPEDSVDYLALCEGVRALMETKRG